MRESLLIKNTIAGTSSFHLCNQQIILKNTRVNDMWAQHGIGRPHVITLCFTALHRFFFNTN